MSNKVKKETSNVVVFTASRLKAERVQELLRRLPGWRLTRDKKAIARTFKLPGRTSAAAFTAMAAAVAVETGHPLNLTLLGATVICKIASPEAAGPTLADFDLAKRLSQAA